MSQRRPWIVSLTALCCAFAGSAFATEYGTIVSSTPVLGQVSTPQRECYDEQVAVRQPRSSGGGAIVGALIGGAVGNSVGAGMGRAAATALGAVTGAAIGDRAEANSQPPVVQTVQRCRRTSRAEDRIVGYDVVYDYAGQRRSARLSQDPGGPGTRIALDVSIAPSGGNRPAALGRVGTPVPLVGARRSAPVYEDDEMVEPAPRVYQQQPYYVAPAPVVYAPYPAYPVYYPAPSIWIGGSWGWGGHRHRHW